MLATNYTNCHEKVYIIRAVSGKFLYASEVINYQEWITAL